VKKHIREFLSEPAEWHAFWFGFYSSFFRLRLRNRGLREEIEKEYHYYTFGFFLGRLCQIIAAAFIFPNLIQVFGV